MEESTENSQRVEEPSSSSSLISFPSTSRIQEEEGNNGGSSSSRNEAFPQPEQLQNHQEQRQRGYGVSYRFNFSISNVSPSEIRDDVWSCVFVLVTFWLLASMTLILGFYGSVTIQLGPNYSRLIQTNRFFVQSIKLLAENGESVLEKITAHKNFFILATMNPGGDHGKKELSPALRNRFTEIWVPPVTDVNELRSIASERLFNHEPLNIIDPMLKFL